MSVEGTGHERAARAARSGRRSRVTPTRLFMTADAVGGVWTYALDLARGLQAHGIETRLAVNGPRPSPPAYRPAPACGVEVVAPRQPQDWHP